MCYTNLLKILLILQVLQCMTIASITVEFETNPEMYIEVARHLL